MSIHFSDVGNEHQYIDNDAFTIKQESHVKLECAVSLTLTCIAFVCQFLIHLSILKEINIECYTNRHIIVYGGTYVYTYAHALL